MVCNVCTHTQYFVNKVLFTDHNTLVLALKLPLRFFFISFCCVDDMQKDIYVCQCAYVHQVFTSEKYFSSVLATLYDAKKLAINKNLV